MVGESGGAAKATLLLCLSLARLGKQVTLFVTLPPDSQTTNRLRDAGVTVVASRVQRGWRLGVPHWFIAVQLYWWARRNAPARVHAVSLSSEARHFLRFPSVAPTSLWETTEALPHVKFLDRRIAPRLAQAATVLAPSRTIAENIRATYGYSGQIEILPFWVEPPDGCVHSPTAPPTGKLLYVGRLDVDKGFAYLFDAVRWVRQRHPEVRLVVRGPGPVGPLLQLAGGDPGILIRGYADQDEWEEEMRACDALVLPSLHEGYPLTLLEACGRGKPVIASAVGSIPEVFGGRACALLVPPRDTSALASAIETILFEDGGTYRARCRDALTLFEEISSEEVVQRRLELLYRPKGLD
jgi:glycosyltransferase involved in cell wall biosynthesis